MVFTKYVNGEVQDKNTKTSKTLQQRKKELFDEIEKAEIKIANMVDLLRKLNNVSKTSCQKRCLNGDVKEYVNIHAQSSETKSTEQVNVEFEDVVAGAVENLAVVKNLYQPTISTNASLQEYLSRPVLLSTINWEIGGSVSTTLSPWNLFLDHAAIKKKIDNYSFIRADLHIKIMINASPFYYGAVLASYQPLSGLLAPAPISSANHFVPKSQRPHVYIYPQTNEGAEICLPFLYYAEWLKLGSATTTGQFGALNFLSLDVLRNANGLTAQSVDINVYAWMENVQLAGLTIAAVMQSDEYAPAKGPISKPASAVARAAGLLSTLPVIGPFATATRVAADATSNIASLFGYSKVPVISDAMPYKNMPFRGLASSDISDPTEPLSIDSKNELTVNNTCLGDESTDPLVIKDFVGRKSYLTQFEWAATDATTQLIWNTYVTPGLFYVASGTNQTIIQPTPMGLVSRMFTYWRGDVIFEFKILCSQYHRGRLRFTWDPTGAIGTTADSLTEAYNQIVDIQDTTHISMRVPYMQDFAYQKNTQDITTTVYNTTALAPDVSGVTNGLLTVRVLNEQTSPVETAPITILVSVRGAENLEFAAPAEVDPLLSYFTVQSSERILGDITEKNFGAPSTVDNNINLVYMGEKIETMRSLTARCNHSLTLNYESNEYFNSLHTSVINRRPIFPGYDTEGIHTATGLTSTTPENYNFVSNSPYHLLRPCFLGERGGIVWKVNVYSEKDRTIMLDRKQSTTLKGAYATTTVHMDPLISSSVSNFFVGYNSTNSGVALVNQKTQSGMSATFPMYTRASFLETNPIFAVEGLSTTESALDAAAIKVATLKSATVFVASSYEPASFLFQTGVDHSFYYFLNCPTIYLYDSAPVPVAAA